MITKLKLKPQLGDIKKRRMFAIFPKDWNGYRYWLQTIIIVDVYRWERNCLCWHRINIELPDTKSNKTYQKEIIAAKLSHRDSFARLIASPRGYGGGGMEGGCGSDF